MTRAVSRGAPQIGAIYPVLLFIVMDKSLSLSILDRSGVEIANFGDLAFLAQFPSVITDLIEGASEKVCI